MNLYRFLSQEIEIMAKLKKGNKGFRKTRAKCNIWVDLGVTKKKIRFHTMVYFYN
ncbi:hypothetical protein PGB90_004701 [Kerria lacca]